MRKLILPIGLALFLFGVFAGCSKNTETPLSPVKTGVDDFAEPTGQAANLYQHGPVVNIDGKDYYLAGAPDGPNGATDIPGHSWIEVRPNVLTGRHVNTGPFGKSKWWSSDAPDGALLYKVQGIIDTWSMNNAKLYAKKGFIHYHEMVRVSDGKLHPSKVLWLRHIGMRSFTLDGGPHPELAHKVKPGIDWEFIPNGMMPYNPED